MPGPAFTPGPLAFPRVDAGDHREATLRHRAPGRIGVPVNRSVNGPANQPHCQLTYLTN